MDTLPAKKIRLLKTGEPKEDESFMGYLLRVSALNWFATPSWMLQLAKLQNYVQSKLPFVFDNSLNLLPLAQLTGVNEHRLNGLIYHPVGSIRRKMGDYLVFGNPVPQYVIRPSKPKICPSCLSESSYIRQIWELAPVTVCPVHRCLLLDECPNCARSIPWVRKAVSICQCKFDWRVCSTANINDLEMRVTQHIYQLCNLSTSVSTSIEAMQVNPLYTLELKHFLSALFFVASQYGAGAYEKGKRRIDTKGKHFVPLRCNADIHALLCKAVLAFDDWPTGYFSFLDWRWEQDRGSERIRAKHKYYEEYKSTLFIQLANSAFDFMRSGFLEYRRMKRQKVILVKEPKSSSLKRLELNSTLRNDPVHISRDEVMKLLKTNADGIEKLIVLGELKTGAGNTDYNEVLIERASFEEFRTELKKSLTLRQMEKLFGVRRWRIIEMVNSKILNPLRGPVIDGYSFWRFRHKEIEDLLAEIENKVSKAKSLLKSETITLKQVLRHLDRVNLSLGAFMQAVLNDEIQIYRKGKKHDLTECRFLTRQVAEFAKDELKHHLGDVLALPEVAQSLGVTDTAVRFLVKKNFLIGQIHPSFRSFGTLVKNSDLEHFNSMYMLPSKIARDFGTESGYLTEALIEEGIHPVSGRKVDRGPLYIFRRSDVESVDMAGIVSSARWGNSMAGKDASLKAKPPILTEAQTAIILGVDAQTIRQLAERGHLKPHKRLLHGRGKSSHYYFSRYTVMKFSKQPSEVIGLISYMPAAKMLNLYPDNFYNKYVRTGRLRPVVARGRRSDYCFWMEDIKVLAEIEKQTIITPEAAEILGVNVSCVDKMIATGVLKPVSGPIVDGFGKNLFLRSDVEQLHRERETFKVERISKGWTSRFGRPKAAKEPPVRSKVGPRINQLIEQWSVKVSRRRVSGPEIYRQLIKEGYKVGIATVYVCLREYRSTRG
jgi:hypothetical protein